MAKRKAEAAGNIGDLLTEWEAADSRFRQTANDVGMLPDLGEVQAFEELTSKLSAWCDSSPVPFDPSPLLAVCRVLKQVVDSAPMAGAASEVPASLNDEWANSGGPALLLIQRILIWLDATGGKMATAPTELSKDAQAIALLFSMPKPTKRMIAKALGYSGHQALDNLPAFCKAWKHYQMSKTMIDRDVKRPGAVRMNGKALDNEFVEFDDE